MKRIALGFLVCLVPAGSVLIARDLPDVNRQQLIDELEKMEHSRKQKWELEIKKVIAEIAGAAQSPAAAVKLYQDAVRATQFAGADQESDKYKAWKKQQEENLGDPDFKTGLQFRFRYLTMVLQLSAGEDEEKMFSELERYVKDLLANDALMGTKKGGARVGGRGAQRAWGGGFGADDPVVQMYRLEPYLKGAKGWPQAPAAVDAMVDGVLMPKYREKKDAKLMAFWDERIERQRLRVDDAGLEMGKDRFETEELPRLLWNRAQDYQSLDEPNRAISEMMALIRQNPGHPDFEKWIGELKALLQRGAGQ
ncbi:MAG: hypothetical protein IT577_00990 [Verrucomicrobiae bacterium]|nr:hypothetical protein [Verrucomicrobiae bacterium]